MDRNFHGASGYPRPTGPPINRFQNFQNHNPFDRLQSPNNINPMINPLLNNMQALTSRHIPPNQFLRPQNNINVPQLKQSQSYPRVPKPTPIPQFNKQLPLPSDIQRSNQLPRPLTLHPPGHPLYRPPQAYTPLSQPNSYNNLLNNIRPPPITPLDQKLNPFQPQSLVQNLQSRPPQIQDVELLTLQLELKKTDA